MKCNKGFTLFELLAVLAILSILAAYAVPKVISTINASKEKTIAYNCRVLAHLIEQSLINFETTHYFSNSGVGSPKEYLSSYLEDYLERVDNGKYSNGDSYKNPFSGMKNVYNWNDLDIIGYTEDGVSYNKPAIFITSDSNAKYDNYNLPAGKEIQFQGTIMVYMSNNGDRVEVYFIEKDLGKSDLLYTSR